MEALLLIAFGAAVIGFITSLIVLLKLVSKKKAQRLEY